jgi:hypothetical protein
MNTLSNIKVNHITNSVPDSVENFYKALKRIDSENLVVLAHKDEFYIMDSFATNEIVLYSIHYDLHLIDAGNKEATTTNVVTKTFLRPSSLDVKAAIKMMIQTLFTKKWEFETGSFKIVPYLNQNEWVWALQYNTELVSTLKIIKAEF